MIYAIEAVGLNAVKFGKAKNPAYRLKELQTGSPFPLKLLAAVDWHDEKEKMLHRALAPARRCGEWFDASPDVEEFVNTMMCPNSTELQKYDTCMGMLDEIFKRDAAPVKNRNAYMREYMRTHPQKKRSRADYMRAYRKGKPWPKRDRAEYMRKYRARIDNA